MEGTDAGRVPRTIEVELTEDNVDSCVPGDVVTICGQVKVSGMLVVRMHLIFFRNSTETWPVEAQPVYVRLLYRCQLIGHPKARRYGEARSTAVFSGRD